MKDSGIEWIGEIPEEWGVRKIKNSFIIISGNGFPIVIQGQEQGDYPVCKASDISINNGKIIFGSDNYITQKQSIAFNIIPKGSVVFPKIGEAMKKNNRALLGVDACLDNNCQGLVPLCMNKKYSLYMLSCIDMFWYDNAGTVPCINNLRFSNSYIPFPLLSEQQKIALFLDKKCSEIDSLTADIQKQIEILEQYKKSVITETVTKGLDPNVKMKDSGIEWIGEIPEEWEVRRLKQCIIGISDGTHGTFQRVSSGKLLLSAKNVFEDGIHINENESMISENDHNLITSNGFPKKNDILLCCVGTVGRCSLYPFEEPIAFQRSVAMLRSNCDVIAYRLLFYCLLSDSVLTQERLITNKSAQEGLYQGAIKELRLCLPKNTDEQILLISYLDSKCSRLDELIRLKNQQLETLAQYKKSLIYEYVTGKRELN